MGAGAAQQYVRGIGVAGISPAGKRLGLAIRFAGEIANRIASNFTQFDRLG
jgi:hypothetical protein